MSKPFPLQTLLELARAHSDDAAVKLGVLNRHDQQMEERLQLLLEYRAEYAANLTRMAGEGMSSVDWRNFHEFIDKIDAAIAQQRQVVAAAKNGVQAGQQHWHEEQRKLKSFDTLSERHHSAEFRRETKQEQKEQDEFALKGFLSRRVAIS